MTPESTMGNLCGSRIESVIGTTFKTDQTLTLGRWHLSLPNLCLRRRRQQCYQRVRPHTPTDSKPHTQSAVGSPLG